MKRPFHCHPEPTPWTLIQYSRTGENSGSQSVNPREQCNSFGRGVFMNSRQVLTLVVSRVVCFQSTLAQQSTTGPTPPPNTAVGYKAASATQVVVPGVPAYLWRCRCGPTAVGMVVGYWDSNGYPGLIAGSAPSQTGAVDSAIATPEHYDDYSLPLDHRPNLLADKSTLGGAHSSNSIPDFMNTSWSSRGDYYGWIFNVNYYFR